MYKTFKNQSKLKISGIQIVQVVKKNYSIPSKNKLSEFKKSYLVNKNLKNRINNIKSIIKLLFLLNWTLITELFPFFFFIVVIFVFIYIKKKKNTKFCEKKSKTQNWKESKIKKFKNVLFHCNIWFKSTINYIFNTWPLLWRLTWQSNLFKTYIYGLQQ